MLPSVEMFVASCDLHRCTGICLELSCFATSYSTCRFLLQNQSYMCQTSLITYIYGEFCPCVVSKAIIVSQ